MNKSISFPITIIIAGLLMGGAVLFSGQNKNTSVSAYPADARVLTLSVPNMVCAGCAASIENYVKSMPGVLEVSVTLSTKSGIFLYDPARVTKEEIIKNSIFDIYAPKIVADDKYDRLRHQFGNADNLSLPLAIQEKSNRASQLFFEKQQTGADVSQIKAELDQVDELLAQGRNQEAEISLDNIIKSLELL